MLIFSILICVFTIYLIIVKSGVFKFKSRFSDTTIIKMGVPSAFLYGFATIRFIKVNITILHLNHIILVMIINIINIGLILLLSFLVDTKYRIIEEIWIMERMDLFNSEERNKNGIEIFDTTIITPIEGIRDLEIWDIEQLIDKTNPKMLKLINNNSSVDYSKDYHTKGFTDNLPLLSQIQILMAEDIYKELLCVARTRVMLMLVNYYNCVKSIKFYGSGMKVDFNFYKGGYHKDYTLVLSNNGERTILNNNTRKVIEYKEWKELQTSPSVGSIDKDFIIILKKIDLMWAYTIQRLKVKAYILALNNLTVKTYKDYLRQ